MKHLHDHLAGIEKSKAGANALSVVRRLNAHGHPAYLVGGCIRDTLLGTAPKDFDVATAALPHQVRKLFRNSRIIGRRFRIVHVIFGREVIEVTTFRGPHNSQYERNRSQSGMVLSDNIYGTLDEDILRRDFTMNAIYYDAVTGECVDSTHGRDDIQRQLIRTIGLPEKRFREDPVRMLRAIRFEAKLGFQIEESTVDAIHKLGELIQNVSPARLYEETLKLFMSGHGLASLQMLVKHHLCQWVFPEAGWLTEDGTTARLALESTDKRIKKQQPVTPAFIYAALLWLPFVTEKQRIETKGRPKGKSWSEMHAKVAGNVIANQRLITAIPRRIATPVKDIWLLQSRLLSRADWQLDNLIKDKRFPAAYDFLMLREQAGEETNNMGVWWTRYLQANEATKLVMKNAVSKEKRH